MKTQDKDSCYLARSMPSNHIEILRTNENFLYDINEKRYIDFYSGWCVGNLGWDNKKIKSELNKFDGPDYVTPFFLYKPWADLAELLATITPGNLTKSFRATGGSEAVEIALSAANAYTKRSNYISIEGSYHGDSMGAMSVGASPFQNAHPGLLKQFKKIKPPLNEKTLEEVERLLAKNDVAAFIMEPIICNLAVLIPDQTFMFKLQELCRAYGTLLIIDEVATGFGRTGKLFATEHFNFLEPDIMCMAKAITGGYGPMGATITTPEVAKSMESESCYYSTYGWYPRSVAAALLNIHYLLDNKQFIENNTEELSTYFKDRLEKIDFNCDVDIRVKGLAIGIVPQQKNYAREIVKEAQKQGLLVAPQSGDCFAIFPALTISKEVAKEGLDILEFCVEKKNKY